MALLKSKVVAALWVLTCAADTFAIVILFSYYSLPGLLYSKINLLLLTSRPSWRQEVKNDGWASWTLPVPGINQKKQMIENSERTASCSELSIGFALWLIRGGGKPKSFLCIPCLPFTQPLWLVFLCLDVVSHEQEYLSPMCFMSDIKLIPAWPEQCGESCGVAWRLCSRGSRWRLCLHETFQGKFFIYVLWNYIYSCWVFTED